MRALQALTPIAVASTLVVGCASVRSGEPNLVQQQRSMEDLIASFSEEALAVDSGGTLVASRNCNNLEETNANSDLSLTNGETRTSVELHNPWGQPVATGDVDNESVLATGEFVVNHDADLLTATWAAHRLTNQDIVSRTRVDCFRADPRLLPQHSAVLFDYVEPVFDRGHIVPRADMNRGFNAMLNTFVLSNMAPQHDNFNQGLWATLEGFVRSWAKAKDTVFVLTGAVFDGDSDGTRDEDAVVPRIKQERVGIASAFYKVVLHERANGFVESIAILLPHGDDVSKNAPFEQKVEHLRNHITTIDHIEEVSGYDLFPDMEAAKQTAVEASRATDLW